MKILELTYSQFTQEMKQWHGKDKFISADIYRRIFKGRDIDFRDIIDTASSGHGSSHGPYDSFRILHKLLSENTGLKHDDTSCRYPSDFIDRLKNDIRINLDQVVREKKEDDVIKFVTRLQDSYEIETVLIPMFTHNTLCVSSQAGCRMGCRFCETGALGLHRNLNVEEITGQVYYASVIKGYSIKNIVFMGMGEPFDNLENVMQAVRVINDQRGLDIALSRITISTAGLVDGIERLGNSDIKKVNLAISLNASNNRTRSEIMPVNRKFPMEKLMEAISGYPLGPSGSIFIEYVLLKGVNDTREHARELAEFLKPVSFKINLIPYNPGTDPLFMAPSEDDLIKFRDYLVQEKVFVRIRATRGRSVMAACGQLGNREYLKTLSSGSRGNRN